MSPDTVLGNFTLSRIHIAHLPHLGSGTCIVKMILNVSWITSCSMEEYSPGHNQQRSSILRLNTFSAWNFTFSCVLCLTIWIIIKLSFPRPASAPRIIIVSVSLLEQQTIIYSYSHKKYFCHLEKHIFVAIHYSCIQKYLLGTHNRPGLGWVQEIWWCPCLHRIQHPVRRITTALSALFPWIYFSLRKTFHITHSFLNKDSILYSPSGYLFSWCHGHVLPRNKHRCSHSLPLLFLLVLHPNAAFIGHSSC